MSDKDEMGEDRTVGVKVYFNPFAFTIEQNNEFLRRGYEPTPMQVPEMEWTAGW